MPKEARLRRILTACALVVVVLSAIDSRIESSVAYGEEPAKRFLEQLLAKKYYDIALDYLDEIEKRSNLPSEIKDEIPLLRAQTLRDSIILINGLPAKEKRLEESNNAYAKFLTEHGAHPSATQARLEAAAILHRRSALKLAFPKNIDAPKKAELEKQAAELLKQSAAQYMAIREELGKKLAPLKTKRDANQELTAEEKVVQSSLLPMYITVRFKVAESIESQADANPEGSPDHKKLLEAALEEFKDLYKDYGGKGYSASAVLAEGRVRKKLKDFPGAVKALTMILEGTKSEGGIVKDVEKREVGLTALNLAMECWLDESQKAYPAAIAASMAWINEIEPSEQDDPSWLHLRYLSALAHKKFADDAKAKNAKDENAKKAITEARKLAQQVSKYDCLDQAPARKLLADMGIEVAAVTPSALVKIKTFEQAKEAALEALNAAIELPERENIIKERLEVEKDPEQIAILKKELEETKGGTSKGFQGAIDGFRRALQLVTPTTTIEEVNSVRWELARCFYLTQQFEEASIVGEFVARRFPTDRQAKGCANVALDSVKKVYLDGIKAKRNVDVEVSRMMSLSELMIKNWPNDEEASSALRLLIGLRVNVKDYDGVVALLTKIPEASPFRAEAESKAGQALWSQYLIRQNELRQAANGAAVAADPQAEQMKAKAIELLQSSIKRFGGAPPSTPSVTAIVWLADIFAKSNNPQQAAVLLDDPTTGPMTLLAKDMDGALFNESLAELTCRVSLSSQIAMLPTATDSAAAIAKLGLALEKLTELLKKAGGGDDQRVVAVYYTLARDMKQQLDLTKDPKIKVNLANGAEKFLLGVKSNTKDAKLLRWVGEAFVGFGESFDSGVGPPTGDAKRYFTAAAEAFEEALKQNLEPAIGVAVRVQQASVLRELGDYKKAYENLLTILKDPTHRNTAKFQMEAARVLAEWGTTGGEKYFKEAISGTEIDPAKKENIIWGLAKISKLTRTNPQYVNTFFDSRYTIALCYFGQAKLAKGDQGKARLGTVKNEISSVYQLYPQLGGPEWTAKFDALLRRVQREAGEPDLGLAAIKKAPEPKKPTAPPKTVTPSKPPSTTTPAAPVNSGS